MSLRACRTAKRQVTSRRMNGSMAVRWAAAAILEAEDGDRRIIGYGDLWMLNAHLVEFSPSPVKQKEDPAWHEPPESHLDLRLRLRQPRYRYLHKSKVADSIRAVPGSRSTLAGGLAFEASAGLPESPPSLGPVRSRRRPGGVSTPVRRVRPLGPFDGCPVNPVMPVQSQLEVEVPRPHGPKRPLAPEAAGVTARKTAPAVFTMPRVPERDPALLTGGLDDGAQGGEALCALGGTEAAGDFLTQLDYPEISLGLVVCEGDLSRLVEEVQALCLTVLEAERAVVAGPSLGPSVFYGRDVVGGPRGR